MAEFLTITALKSFFGKYWEILLVLAVLVGGGWYLDHRGAERQADADKLRQLEQQQITAAVVSQIDGKLGGQLSAIATSTDGKIQTIDTGEKTVVQPIITREILRDHSLTDPTKCLSPGLLGAVNAARGYLDEHLAGADTGSGNPAPVPAGAQGH